MLCLLVFVCVCLCVCVYVCVLFVSCFVLFGLWALDTCPHSDSAGSALRGLFGIWMKTGMYRGS